MRKRFAAMAGELLLRSRRVDRPVFSLMTQDVLYEGEDRVCDRCEAPVLHPNDPPGLSWYFTGRHGERSFETKPLCKRCSREVGISAQVRWEPEEDEG